MPGDPVRDKIAEVNRIISKLDDQQHVFYMDIGAKFLDEKGVFLPDTFRADNLHPQAKGYDIWGEAVKDKLAELMKDQLLDAYSGSASIASRVAGKLLR